MHDFRRRKEGNIMTKKRSRTSYHGNTPEMIKHQRLNITPGNAWDKRRKREMKLNCWWEGADLDSQQFIYEGYQNKRETDDVPKEGLKDEEYLYEWWSELEISDWEYIYKVIMKELTKEHKARILKNVYECLEEKIEKEKANREEIKEMRLARK